MYIYIEEKKPFISKLYHHLKASRKYAVIYHFLFTTHTLTLNRCMQIVINWTPRGLGAGYD